MFKINFAKHKGKFFSLVLAVLLIGLSVFLAVKPMRSSEGMWRTFDDVQTARTIAVVKELNQGQFPVRILQEFGNGGGYLLFNFYSPVVYYLSASLVFLGTQPLNAVKLVFQLAYLLAGVGMYLCLKILFPKSSLIAITGSLLLLGSTYFNYDAYVRGALPELFGFSLIPWVFWSYFLLRKFSHFKLTLGILATSLALLICSHSLTGFIAIPLLYLLILIDWKLGLLSFSAFKSALIAGLLALGLASFYILPLVFEQKYISYDQINFVVNGFRSTFTSVGELLGLTRATDKSILPITLGFWLSLGTFLALSFTGWLVWKKLIKFKSNEYSLWLFLVLGLFATLFIQTKLSWLIWENFSWLQMTQFPYRYLTITTILAILVISLALSKLKQAWQVGLLGVCLVAITWTANQSFMTPSSYYFAADFKAEDPCGTSTWEHEYLPHWTSECLLKGNSLAIATGSGELSVVQTNYPAQTNNFEITTNGKSGELIITKYYFPGWEIKSGGVNLPLYPTGPNGLIGVKLTEADSQLKVQFRDTRIRSLGNQITILSGLIFLSLVFVDGFSIIRSRKKQLLSNKTN